MLSLASVLEKIEAILGVDGKAIYTALNVNQTTYSNYKTGERKNAHIDFYEKFKTVFGIDLYQSMRRGVIIITDPTRLPHYQFKRLIDNGAVTLQIPVYDIDVTAGVVQLHRDETDIKPAFALPKEICEGGTFGVRVKGDSMEPDICNRDYVICRQLLSTEDIIPGRIYLVILRDGVEAIKKVHVHKKDKNLLMLVSTNPGWPVRFAGREKEVLQLFEVTKFVRNKDVLNKFAIPVWRSGASLIPRPAASGDNSPDPGDTPNA